MFLTPDKSRVKLSNDPSNAVIEISCILHLFGYFVFSFKFCAMSSLSPFAPDSATWFVYLIIS